MIQQKELTSAVVVVVVVVVVVIRWPPLIVSCKPICLIGTKILQFKTTIR